ncbi:hypothetical protein ACIOG7_31980 [Streptomyces sp. NPDC087894]|uniref:hypothetical protein n=1 Tax=Streptomyces sp. NPDC087894 TaxID=3365816 RepID=UPI003829E7B7
MASTRRSVVSSEDRATTVRCRAARMLSRSVSRRRPEAVVETVGDLARGEQPEAGGGQLDGEREAVEPAADLGDGPRVVGGVRVGFEVGP